MEISVKRRIVGATVMAIFAIIILPVLFDGDGQIPESELPTMPPVIKKPDTSELKVDLPVNARMQDPDQPEPTTRSEVQAASQDAPEQPVGLDESGQPRSWSLQIASFKSSENAARLRDELRSLGYRAYQQENPLSNGSVLTQVMVGPEQEYDKVISLRKTMQSDLKSLGVNGPPLVVKYTP